MPVGSRPYHEDDRLFLFLAYFGLLALVPFVLYKDRQHVAGKDFVFWHAAQGLAFFLVAVCFQAAMVLVSLVLAVLRLPSVSGVVFTLGWMLPLFLVGVAWVKAFRGKRWDIPLAGPFAARLRA